MGIAPAEFPPPVDEHEFVGPPTDAEDERIEVGVAIVGGGPAGLACAIKLTQLLENEPELAERLGEVPVALVEKGKTPGAHLLSGANMRPSAMEELFPDLGPEDWPVYGQVEKDAVYLLTKRQALPLKPMPPNFKNHGNYVTSVAELGRFLSEKAEQAGVYILPETAATKLLVEDRIVKGVRTGDKGRGKDGEPLSNFEPGVDVTDVRQTKGLEFDEVVLLDTNAASYPATPQARHALYVGATRAAHQLWCVASEKPSPVVVAAQEAAAASQAAADEADADRA